MEIGKCYINQGFFSLESQLFNIYQHTVEEALAKPPTGSDLGTSD